MNTWKVTYFDGARILEGVISFCDLHNIANRLYELPGCYSSNVLKVEIVPIQVSR